MSHGRTPYDNSSMVARQEYLAGGNSQSDVLGAVGQVVQTMGLFGKMRGIMDEAQIRTREDDIARAMGDSGDINSIPRELTHGRIATIAISNIMGAKAKTEEGKLSLAQNARKLATIDLQNIQAGMEQANAARTAADSLKAQADQARQAGDMTAAQGFEAQANQNYDLSAKHIETTSHNIAMPYKVRHIGGGQFEELFTGSPDGKPQPTGRTYSADQIVGQAQKALQDTPSYLKMVHLNTATAMDHNVEVSRNQDKWVTAKVLDKDGNPTKQSREFVPFLNVVPGQPVQTAYYDSKDQKAYNSVEELMAAGFSAPESKAGALQSDKIQGQMASLAEKTRQHDEMTALRSKFIQAQIAAREAAGAAAQARAGRAAMEAQVKIDELARKMAASEVAAENSVEELAKKTVALKLNLAIDRSTGALGRIVGGEFTQLPDGDKNLGLFQEGVKQEVDRKMGAFPGREKVTPAPTPPPPSDQAQDLWNSRKARKDGK